MVSCILGKFNNVQFWRPYSTNFQPLSEHHQVHPRYFGYRLAHCRFRIAKQVQVHVLHMVENRFFCDPHFWEYLQTRPDYTTQEWPTHTKIYFLLNNTLGSVVIGRESIFFTFNCQGVPQTLQQSGQTLNSQVRKDLKTSLAGPTTDHQAPYPHTNIPGDRLTSFYFRNLFFGLTIPVFPSLKSGISPSHPVTNHQNPLLFSEFTLWEASLYLGSKNKYSIPFSCTWPTWGHFLVPLQRVSPSLTANLVAGPPLVP